MIVTTHEEEFVALNNVLKDNMPSAAQDMIVFPQDDEARDKDNG